MPKTIPRPQNFRNDPGLPSEFGSSSRRIVSNCLAVWAYYPGKRAVFNYTMGLDDDKPKKRGQKFKSVADGQCPSSNVR